MPFQKGTSGNPEGRPKSIREHQDDIRTMLYEFIKANFSEVLTDLDTMSTKDRMRVFLQLLKHVEPRFGERAPMLNLDNATEEQLDKLIQQIHSNRQ